MFPSHPKISFSFEERQIPSKIFSVSKNYNNPSFSNCKSIISWNAIFISQAKETHTQFNKAAITVCNLTYFMLTLKYIIKICCFLCFSVYIRLVFFRNNSCFPSSFTWYSIALLDAERMQTTFAFFMFLCVNFFSKKSYFVFWDAILLLNP